MSVWTRIRIRNADLKNIDNHPKIICNWLVLALSLNTQTVLAKPLFY